MPSYKELKAKAEDLMRQAEEARKSEIAAVVADIKAKMVEFNISIADLRGAARKGGKRSAVAPKYRDPASGQTWSGRGKEPKWLAAYLAKGKKRDDYLIR